MKQPIPRKCHAASQPAPKKIRILLMDVDGVLTDGHVWLLSHRDWFRK